MRIKPKPAEWTQQWAKSSSPGSDPRAPMLGVLALATKPSWASVSSSTECGAWIALSSSAGGMHFLKYRPLGLALRFYLGGLWQSLTLFWEAVDLWSSSLLATHSRILTLFPRCPQIFLPEPWDHLGKANDLLDAVTDQVSQVGQHGEVGQV